MTSSPSQFNIERFREVASPNAEQRLGRRRNQTTCFHFSGLRVPLWGEPNAHINCLQLTRVEQDIVVRTGDNVAGCLERAGIARSIRARSLHIATD